MTTDTESRFLTRQAIRRLEESSIRLRLHCEAERSPERSLRDVPDSIYAYVVSAQVPFELLREAASQLAALLILSAAGGKSAQDNPIFSLAKAQCHEANELVGQLCAPMHGCHHYRHLQLCSAKLVNAFLNASTSLHRMHSDCVDRTLVILRSAFEHLKRAVGALPGFEVVSIDSSCCAMRASSGLQER